MSIDPHTPVPDGTAVETDTGYSEANTNNTQPTTHESEEDADA